MNTIMVDNNNEIDINRYLVNHPVAERLCESAYLFISISLLLSTIRMSELGTS